MFNDHILFVVSKSTGYIALKSFLEVNINSKVTVLIFDDRNDQRSRFEDIKVISEKYNIKPLIATNKDCLDKAVRGYKPDLVFVCGWYWIISNELLAMVPQGFLGIHNSLLPKYRGHAPLVWSMLNGDEYVGSSLFKIEAGMDTGNIFYQWKIKANNLYLTEVLNILDVNIYSNFGTLLLNVLQNKLRGVPQNNNNATYSSKRREEDGYIDWSLSASDIILKIKALSEPYPNAFTFSKGKKIKLKQVDSFEFPTFGECGQVAFVTSDYAVICCAYGEAIKVLSAEDMFGESNILKLFARISSPLKFFE